MGIPPFVLIIIALAVLALIIWFLLSRNPNRPAGEHVDTSVTAVGAAVDAARNVVEQVEDKIEHALASDVEATDATPEPAPVTKSKAATTKVTKATKESASGAAKGTSKSAPKIAAVTSIGIPAAAGAPDDLRVIKGLGPKLNSLLNDLGITRYDQIAAWGEPEIAKVDGHLGTFKGRIVRDSWIEQAKLLAKGDEAGFEAKFGKLDKPGKA